MQVTPIPTTAQAMIAQAKAETNPTVALDILKKGIQQFPDDFSLRKTRVEVYQGQNAWGEAMALDLLHMRSLQPKNITVLSWLCEVHLELQKWSELLNLAQAVFQKESTNAYVRKYLAKALPKLEQSVGAELKSVYLNALIDSWDKEVYQLQDQKKHFVPASEKVLEYLNQALQDPAIPERLQYLRKKADTLFPLQRFRELTGVLHEILVLNPKEAYALSMLVKVHTELKEWPKAVTRWEQLYQLDPTHKGAYLENVTRAILETSKIGGLNQYIESHPDDAGALALRAQVHEKESRWQKALSDANQALSQEPGLKFAEEIANRARAALTLEQVGKVEVVSMLGVASKLGDANYRLPDPIGVGEDFKMIPRCGH